MIIIPSGAVIQSEQIVDDPNEDDIHICGACKKHFNDIFNFMRHKTENSCRLKHCKEETSITLPSTSPPNSNAVLSSSSGSTLRSNRAGTKYTRVALVNTEAFTIEKEDILKDVSSSSPVTNVQSPPSSHPPHLLLADLASQRLGLLNQDLPPEDRANGSEINLDDDWDSSWSAAKVLGTFSVSNSLRRLQNQSLLTLKEHENVEELAPDEDNLQEKSRCQEMEAAPMETATDTSVLTISGEKSLATQMHTVVDCQVPERFIGPHGGFLDVEDVEVATLLANHLTNEPALHIYPHTSESYLSYNNLQNHLVIQDSSDNLTFENSGGCEEVPDGNSDEPGTVKSTKVIGNKVSPKVFQQNKPQKPVRNRKVYPCALEGCNFCGISARDLARHVNKHTGERPFKCQECEKTFTRPDKLSAHLRCHSSEEKTYNCNICEFTCRLRNGLVIHMRRHNDERPYKCQICEYKARTKSHLNVHLRKHTGDHPYKCKKCSRAFTTRSDLTRHSRLHSGDKPFACPHCNYSAALQSSLKTHMQLNHIPGVSLVCSKCNAQCQSRKDFRAHVKTHKDDPKHCTKCDFIGSSSIALRNHLRVHLSEKIRSSPFLNGKKGSSRTQQKKRNPSKKQRKEEDDEDIPEVHNCPYCNTSFWREDALEQHIGQHQLEELSAVRAPAPQDPVLADSADSRDSTDSTSMDATCGLADLAALASEQQLLYRYIAGSHSSSEGHDDNDDLRNAEILASLNQSSGGLPQYVTIQTEQGTLVDTLNCIQYVLPSPLGTLDDNDNDDNATTLLC